MTRLKIFAIWTFALFLMSSAVGAQQPTALLTGVVVDPNGAVIPGAKILAVEVSKHVERTTTSNSEGTYILANLPVGIYSIEITSPGFKKQRVENVQLTVGQSVTQDINVSVEGISELSELLSERR